MVVLELELPRLATRDPTAKPDTLFVVTASVRRESVEEPRT